MKSPVLVSSIFCLCLSSAQLSSDEVGGVLVDGGEFDCLPLGTFGLNGLLLSEPEVGIQSTLGEAESITVGWSEDDGGRHDVITYHYDGFDVDAVRGSVDRIYTASESVITGSGFTPGQTMNEVVEILGRVPRGWAPAESSFYIVKCPVNGVWMGEDYLTLEFDSDKILISIEYAVSRP